MLSLKINYACVTRSELVDLIEAAHTASVISHVIRVSVVVIEHPQLAVRVVIADIRSGVDFIIQIGIGIALVGDNKSVQPVGIIVAVVFGNHALAVAVRIEDLDVRGAVDVSDITIIRIGGHHLACRVLSVDYFALVLKPVVITEAIVIPEGVDIFLGADDIAVLNGAKTLVAALAHTKRNTLPLGKIS